MSANEQISFEPSLEVLRADDRETVDSDLGFVKMHYQMLDNQPTAFHRVKSLSFEDLPQEIDSEGKATTQFGKLILVNRRKEEQSEITETQTHTLSVIHSLRQLYTKLKLNDNIIQKPSLLQTTIIKVGYEGDFDLLEELIGKCNLFQDSYPYSFIKTSRILQPKVHFQFRLSRCPGPKSGGDFTLEERGVLGLKDVLNSFSEVEIIDQNSIRVEWPAYLKDQEEENFNQEGDSNLLVVLRNKYKVQTEWISKDLMDKDCYNQSSVLGFDHFITQMPKKSLLIVEVYYFLGKSHVVLKKADFDPSGPNMWKKVSFHSLSRLEKQKVIEQKLVPSKVVEALSDKLSKISKSEMFFYSYSNFENDPVARIISFESLPDYSKVPHMPLALEEFLSKKLKKK